MYEKVCKKYGGAVRRRFSAIREKPRGVVKMTPHQGVGWKHAYSMPLVHHRLEDVLL